MPSHSFRTGLIFCLLLAGPASAHQFWIRPGHFRPEAGAAVRARLFVGDGFEGGEAFRRNERHLRSFQWVQGDERGDVRGLEGRDPAGVFMAPRPGVAFVTYESEPSFARLSAVDFNHYLDGEGLTQAAASRREAGEMNRPAKESFRRCAKALIRVRAQNGAAPGERGTPFVAGVGFDRPLGLDLELVPEVDPTRPGLRALPVRLLWKGEPLAGAQVQAFREPTAEPPRVSRETAGEARPSREPEESASGSEKKTSREARAVTDSDGRATLTLSESGVWMLSAVHLERAAPDERVDWQSVWTSLTFEVSASPVTPATER